ncbi:MAG: hypothetical protein AAGC55_18265, partial [Myxococcota bacterium]
MGRMLCRATLLCALAVAGCSRGGVGDFIDKITEDSDSGDRSDCPEQYAECISSRLGREKGNYPSETRCKECADICRLKEYWPTRTHAGKDCQWWHYR